MHIIGKIMKAKIEQSPGVAETLSESDFDINVNAGEATIYPESFEIDMPHKLMNITKESSPKVWILLQACGVESFSPKEGLVLTKRGANEFKTITVKYGDEIWSGCMGALKCDIDGDVVNLHFQFSGKLEKA